MNSKHILIVGIPGTGKTTVANFLAEKHGYVHIDLEAAETLSEEALLAAVNEYVEHQAGSEQKIVFSWGFPFQYTVLVLLMKMHGVTVVWFDCNREAALQTFNTRGGVPEEAFYEQVGNLDTFSVKNVVKPIEYNTYNATGEFKPMEDIAVDLLKLL